MKSALRVLPVVTAVIAGAALFTATPASAGIVSPPISITSASCPSNIVQNDYGPCVTALQDVLINWGFQGDLGPDGANGQFGPDTKAAVEAFQTAAGIGVDGQVGPQTKGALGTVGPGPAISYITMGTNSDSPHGECLDADTQQAYTNGQTVWGYYCNGSSQQHWSFYPRPNGQAGYMVVNQYDFECLDASGAQEGVNGQRVQGWACNGSTNQDWDVNGNYGYALTVVNVQDGRCLDADTNTQNRDGQVVQTWTCNGQAQQVWAWGQWIK